MQNKLVKMRKTVFCAAALMLVLCLCFTTGCRKVKAGSGAGSLSETNTGTGYTAEILDEADLLNQAEENGLLSEMQKVTEHCNIIVYTTKDHNYGSTESLAKAWYNANYGAASRGTMIVIDRCLNYLFIYSSETIYRSAITKNKANVISDNIYSYAAEHEYYNCLSKGVEQIYQTLEGNSIAQPMKYISNACIAAVAGLIIAYLIAMAGSATGKASKNEIESKLFSEFSVSDISVVHTGTTKKYSPQSKGGSGGGGGHGGGGGGGGGGGHSI